MINGCFSVGNKPWGFIIIEIGFQRWIAALRPPLRVADSMVITPLRL